jgi:prevent-host-death family protein
MPSVTVHEAKTNLSRLLAEVESGGEVVICRGDKPVARLIAYVPAQTSPRKPGLLKGKIGVFADDAFAPLSANEQAQWDGGV